MIWLYRLFFPLALLLALPFYLRRMFRRGGYAQGFCQRLGFGLPPGRPRRPGVRRYWVQAVSVGEINAITPLLIELSGRPDTEVWLTTTTSTGMELARRRWDDRVVGLSYFPIDWWPCSAAVWRRVRPSVVVLMESELWPEHLQQAVDRRVRVLRINARLSDRSYARMRRIRPLALAQLRNIDRILAASEHDRARFLALGVEPERVTSLGNLKCDVPLDPEPLAEVKTVLLGEMGVGSGPVLLGSSTWPGEEEALLDTYRALREQGLPCGLMLAPRHAERREEVKALLERQGWTYHFRSKGIATKPVDVAVVDTTGELRRITWLADVVFVGKSLPPQEGGQTPVEAAACGKAQLFGPSMSNFRSIVDELLSVGAAEVVADAAALRRRCIDLWRDEALRERMGQAGRKWHAASRGALDRTMREMLLPLGSRPVHW